MKLTWRKLDDKSGLVSVDPDAAVDAWRRDERFFWADVEGYETEELDAWLQEIGLSDTVRACCSRAGAMSRFVPLEEAVFFEFPVHARGAESELVDLGFLCLNGLVITLHRESISILEQMAGGLRDKVHLPQATTSGLVAT